MIIGAGIVGNDVAYHLTRLGETEVTLIDKGPMPNPGGSTGHASNFIFPVDHSKEMTLLTLESMRGGPRKRSSASSSRAAVSRSRGPRSGCRSSAGG